MKKGLVFHLVVFVVFFGLVLLMKGWLSMTYVLFAAGGLAGMIIPDIDHLIYIKLLKPHELTSQRANLMMGNKEYRRTINLLSQTRSERKQLIFHTTLFQAVFVVFAFYVISSSGSLLGRGVVLGFLLHLLAGQVMDFKETGNINNWLWQIRVYLDRDKTRLYLIANLLILILLGFLM